MNAMNLSVNSITNTLRQPQSRISAAVAAVTGFPLLPVCSPVLLLGCAGEFCYVVDSAGVVESLFLCWAADDVGESVAYFSDGVGDEPAAAGEWLLVEENDCSFVEFGEARGVA